MINETFGEYETAHPGPKDQALESGCGAGICEAGMGNAPVTPARPRRLDPASSHRRRDDTGDWRPEDGQRTESGQWRARCGS